MTGQLRSIRAATFKVWYEELEAIVAQDPDDVVPGNRQSAVVLLHELIGVGLRCGAVRPVVIHSSGPSSHAHLMFRYTLDPDFDWSGEIALAPNSGYVTLDAEPFIAELTAASGIAEHDDD
ncbi:MAG TPA: hypothetical protein VK356_13480 [Thermomicrobiales bacterium]|nr:hypothetical protein [Thermomicrobiales bacterium]